MQSLVNVQSCCQSESAPAAIVAWIRRTENEPRELPPRLDYVQIVKDMSNLRSGTRSSPDWITCWLRDHLLRAVVRYNRRHLLNKPFCTFNKPYRFLHAVVFTAVNFRFK